MAYAVSNGHMTDDVDEVLIVTSVTSVCMYGREIGSVEKSHGIGQTPFSYEHYLVFLLFYLFCTLCTIFIIN